VYGAPNGPPADLAGWGDPISDPVEVAESQRIALDSTTENEYYLIWITNLAQVDGGFGAGIAEVELTG
jgi:hypothetical protein